MDLTWLATEAKTLHGVFEGISFSFLLTLFLIGIVLELFKLPMGGTPELNQMVGRLLIAVILMVAVPDVMNILADVGDTVTKQLGSFNDFAHVKERLREQLAHLSWSWVSVKDAVLLVISLLSYVVLLIGLHMADAIFLYAWVLLYVFSPILTACYVLPVTSSATRTLFKSLIEVTVWKCLWAVMGALVWSMAASQVNDPKYQLNFITVIIMNLLLFFSLWKVPAMTAAFLGGGISQMASGIGSNVWDKGQNLMKNIVQTHAIGKVATAIKSGQGQNPEGTSPIGSYKYRNFQNKRS